MLDVIHKKAHKIIGNRSYSNHLKTIIYIYDELMEKFGCLTWYDWNVDAWGTKWSARMDDIDLDEYRLQFWCDTAWCPPNELLEFIADKYKVTVECFYEIEGYGDDGVGKDTFSPNLEEAKI